jgi:hypothetical protein
MNIKLPIKLHNRFDIEVKDIVTGEIVQRAQAENIILNNLFTSTLFLGDWANQSVKYVGYSISFGSGTGVLSADRTTLFNRLGSKGATLVELVGNQAPLASYCTKLIVLAPEEYVGQTITEVGLSGDVAVSTIYTHALIKDSEGNVITLGPKTNTQEITIYRTVFAQPNLETGFTLRGELSNTINNKGNVFTGGMTMAVGSGIRSPLNDPLYAPRLYVNNNDASRIGFSTQINGVITSNIVRLSTSQFNTKIKTISVGTVSASLYMRTLNAFDVNLETLAENNSPIWSGYEFNARQIGVGDGNTTVFNLTWDEAWLTKPKKVYVDGVEVTSGFIFNAGNVTFDTAPADQAVITADYWVKYVPKDIDHVLDIQFSILYGEGVPV